MVVASVVVGFGVLVVVVVAGTACVKQMVIKIQFFTKKSN